MERLTQRATPLANPVIFDYTLPAAALLTYLRLVALAWRSEFRSTEPLDFAGELLPLLGVQKTQARLHLRLLRMAKLLYWSVDAGGRYTIYFLSHAPPDSAKAAPVDGVFSAPLLEDKINLQHQPTGAGIPESGPPADPWADELLSMLRQPAFAQTMQWLERAGVWTDAAKRIAQQIHGNELRGKYFLPTRADVLGWMAYCFAYKRENGIEKSAQVLAANLSNNRRCPEKFRAPRICTVCGYAEGWCQCPGEPDDQYPANFLEFAFESEYDPQVENFWGVCHRCHAGACRCPDQA